MPDATMTDRRPCFADLPVSGNDRTPFDAAHATAALLAYDARRIEGIGGLDLPTEDQLHNMLAEAQHLAEEVEAVQRLAVWRCRESGMAWSEIGARFGISRQAAQQRFGVRR